MKKIVPKNAQLIPDNATRVFEGEIYDVYQWPQKMFDGSSETFEMLKRPDVGVAFAIKDRKVVLVRQKQPHWKEFRYSLPGGRAEKGETGLETAKRETEEETGMIFKDWKLLDIKQGHEKIESFLYLYLATGFEGETPMHHDAGEQIEIELADFDTFLQLAANEPRLESNTIGKYKSLTDLLDAPEFQGQEIESA